MYPFRKTSRTYRLLIDFDLLICDPINTVTPAAAAIAIVQISLLAAMKRKLDFMGCRKRFARWRDLIVNEHDVVNGQTGSKTSSCTKVKCEKFSQLFFPIRWFRKLDDSIYDSDSKSSREVGRIFLY